MRASLEAPLLGSTAILPFAALACGQRTPEAGQPFHSGFHRWRASQRGQESSRLFLLGINWWGCPRDRGRRENILIREFRFRCGRGRR